MKTLKRILLWSTLIFWTGLILSLFQPVRNAYATFLTEVKIYSIEAGLTFPVTFGTSGSGVDIESPIGALNGVQVEILDPAPTAGGSMPVSLAEIDGAFPTLPVSLARFTPRPLGDEDCATCCMAVTDAGNTLALAASATGTYEITVIGAPVSCADGAAPAAVYGTNNTFPDGYARDKRLSTNLDCITNTGETAIVCANPQTATPE